jgi:hypothetical protein
LARPFARCQTLSGKQLTKTPPLTAYHHSANIGSSEGWTLKHDAGCEKWY